MAKKTESRGGKREGSGRKAIFDLGQAEREQIIKDVRAEAEKNRTSFGKELGKIMFGRGNDKRTRLQAMRLYATDVLPKIAEKDVTVTEIKKPQIFIPEELPDSAEAGDFGPNVVSIKPQDGRGEPLT